MAEATGHAITCTMKTPQNGQLDWQFKLKKLALNNVLEVMEGKGDLLRFLHRWWCRHYKRPYKDPLFGEYTIEELLLEFYENLFVDNESERIQANIDITEANEEEEEAFLKKIMGDQYQTKEEMTAALKGVKPK